MADITVLQATVGADTGNAANAQSLAVRASRFGALLTAPMSASLQEAVRRGFAFGWCSQTGVTSQAGLSATTPVGTLYNPAGSGKNAVLWFAGAVFTVAPATAGAVWLAVNTNTVAAATTGTASVTHKNLLLGSANNPVCVPLLAATLPAAPVALCLLGANLTGAITTIGNAATLGRWFNGSVILTPGTALSIQTGVASGASGTFCEYIWEEIPE